MAGLREKKKVRTNQEIVDAAIKLFTDKGFEGATIEDIAEEAEVGVGTVYNYFTSKRGLLLAIAAQETDSLIESGLKIVENPEGPVEDVISELICMYTDCWISTFDRALISEFMVAAFSDTDSIGKELFKLDFLLVEQVGNLIRKYQDRGIIRKDIPADKISMIIFSVWLTAMLIYIGGLLESDQIKPEIHSNISLLFKNWKVEEK